MQVSGKTIRSFLLIYTSRVRIINTRASFKSSRGFRNSRVFELSLLNRMKEWILRFAGYLIPLVQPLPPLGVWTGLMTLPFATYLIMIFTNLPVSLPTALSEFLTPFLLVKKAFLIIGLTILVYSIVHLKMKKKEGLVTSGTYRLVRHPQYFGMILSTIGLTGWSAWILNNTFGIGFLSSSQTIGVWFIQLLAYVALAFVEERYLARNHQEAFKNYASQVPFLVPFFNTKTRFLDVLLSVVIPSILLFVSINIHII
jgi:protein-S-isoprenylcysteine O-methyltransferase Ste14